MTTYEKGHFGKIRYIKGHGCFHKNEPVENEDKWVVILFRKFDQDNSSGLVTMLILQKYIKMDIFAWEHAFFMHWLAYSQTSSVHTYKLTCNASALRAASHEVFRVRSLRHDER